MMPKERSPHSIRLMSTVSAYSAMFWIRSSSLRCISLAYMAVQLYLGKFLGNRSSLRWFSSRSHNSTTLLQWDTRMTLRNRTGVSNFTESRKASFIKSLASWLSAGSRVGIFAKREYQRLSCSFCELKSPGSSAVITTRPASAPV
ncbi:hypothetical protein SDC9_141207 [bioreactor metagenome]|uniref:Uncharacterized protein n=1 Tax=bioreactor metagenome TaxID=1076179 RepID=A0A645DX05_9ZZZZ